MPVLMAERDEAMAPANIAIACRVDAIGRVHFRCSDLTSYAASRFAKIQQAYLKGRLAPSPAVNAALSLILFDGIATEADLAQALTSLDQLYRWDGHVCLDWLDRTGRQNRRHLCPITQTVLALPQAPGGDVRATLQLLDAFLHDLVSSTRRSYSLELLLLDAQAWLYEHLPPPLFAHCIGKVPITGLSRSTLARQESSLALSPVAKRDDEVASHRAFASAIGNYFASHRDDHGTWFINELVTSCRRKRALSNSEDTGRHGASIRIGERDLSGGRLIQLSLNFL